MPIYTTLEQHQPLLCSCEPTIKHCINEETAVLISEGPKRHQTKLVIFKPPLTKGPTRQSTAASNKTNHLKGHTTDHNNRPFSTTDPKLQNASKVQENKVFKRMDHRSLCLHDTSLHGCFHNCNNGKEGQHLSTPGQREREGCSWLPTESALGRTTAEERPGSAEKAASSAGGSCGKVGSKPLLLSDI